MLAYFLKVPDNISQYWFNGHFVIYVRDDVTFGTLAIQSLVGTFGTARG